MKHYLAALLLVADLMECQPDEDKVQRVILRGVQWRFVGARRWQSL